MNAQREEFADKCIDEARHLLALIDTPGWKIFIREMEGKIAILELELRVKHTIEELALLGFEVGLLRSLLNKPKQLADVLTTQAQLQRVTVRK